MSRGIMRKQTEAQTQRTKPLGFTLGALDRVPSGLHPGLLFGTPGLPCRTRPVGTAHRVPFPPAPPTGRFSERRRRQDSRSSGPDPDVQVRPGAGNAWSAFSPPVVVVAGGGTRLRTHYCSLNVAETWRTGSPAPTSHQAPRAAGNDDFRNFPSCAGPDSTPLVLNFPEVS